MTRLILLSLALCLSAGFAAGQEAIVELKVAPAKSVFKGSRWNKPIVIKSKEALALHFDKDAAEQLAKQVDFAKQIVVMFVWQGAAGDKLDYVVAESFPEQITFTMRSLSVRIGDARPNARVFALRSNVKWAPAGAAPRQ